MLGEELGVHVECVEPAPDRSHEVAGKYSTDTLVGFSQGTIISRYIIQYCNLKGTVRNFLSFGGPLSGQFAQSCDFFDISCHLDRWHSNYVAFSDDKLEHWAPASYWNDPSHYQRYLSRSPFLAEANNEINYSEDRKQRFLDIERALFIRFEQETTIVPPESSWWGGYDKYGNIITRNQTQVYNDDLIGIKTLEDQGRATFATLPGRHVQVTREDVLNVVIPFILGN